MRFSFLVISALPLVAVASCVSGPEQRPASVAAIRATPPPGVPEATTPASVEWRYRPASEGQWTYRPDGDGSVATFGPPAGALLTLRCDVGSHRISLTRIGGIEVSVTIRTSYGSTTWPATVTPSGAVAARAANDATLDQIAYSRGRFAIEAGGVQPLIVPAWAEVGRVIEDCRA